MSEVDTIDREELKEMMDRGEEFVLLEVLSEESYRQEHLPGAIRFQDLDLTPEVIPHKSTTVIAYCSSFT